jgi:Domain of unknown function (DUF4351)
VAEGAPAAAPPREEGRGAFATPAAALADGRGVDADAGVAGPVEAAGGTEGGAIEPAVRAGSILAASLALGAPTTAPALGAEAAVFAPYQRSPRPPPTPSATTAMAPTTAGTADRDRGIAELMTDTPCCGPLPYADCGAAFPPKDAGPDRSDGGGRRGPGTPSTSASAATCMVARSNRSACRAATAVDRGRKDGRRDGERKGRRALLLKQLRLRFGDLPAAVVARIEAAEVQELDTWAERFVTASRLEDVLGPG